MQWVFDSLNHSAIAAQPGVIQVRPRPELAVANPGLALLVLDQGPDVLVRGPGPVEKLVLDAQAGLDDFLAAEIAQAYLKGQELPRGYRKWAEWAAHPRQDRKGSLVPMAQTAEGLFLGARCVAGPNLLLPAAREQMLASWSEIAALIWEAAAADKEPGGERIKPPEGPLTAAREFLDQDQRQFAVDQTRGEWWGVKLPPDEAAGKAVLLRAPKARLFRAWAQEQSGHQPLLLTGVQAGPGEWIFQTEESRALPLLGEELDRLETQQGPGDPAWKRLPGGLLASPTGGSRIPEGVLLQRLKSWANATGSGGMRARMAGWLWAVGFLFTLGSVLILAFWWSGRVGPLEGHRGLVFRPKTAQRPGTLHVLSIGISSYKDKTRNLRVADKDAEAIAQVLKKQQGKVFNKVQTKTLTNQNAGYDAIVNGLYDIAAAAGEEDLILITVSGHADAERGKHFYFLPHDYEEQGKSNRGIYWDTFKRALGGHKCPVILILDTCHSGAATLDMPMGGFMDKAQGFMVLAACRGQESAKERSDWGHGALTLAFLEVVEGAYRVHDTTSTLLPPYTGKNLVSLEDLSNYVKNRVVEIAGHRPVSNNSGDVALQDVFISRRE